jgi:DNA polymerase delta subunit 3
VPSNGGSLATMWGRASAKPKAPAVTKVTDLPSVPGIFSRTSCFKPCCFTFWHVSCIIYSHR